MHSRELRHARRDQPTQKEQAMEDQTNQSEINITGTSMQLPRKKQIDKLIHWQLLGYRIC